MKKIPLCEHCGAKMVQYTFTFNKGLARSLWRISKFNEPVEIRTLNMPSTEWTNFQKLKYWDLIAAVEGENARRGGCWAITEKGKKFVRGETTIQKRVVMYRNKRVGYVDDLIHYKDITGGYEYRQDYKDQVTNATP